MKLLHICSDYSNQGLYRQLILSLERLGLKQIVYVPVRNNNEVGAFNIHNNNNIKIEYRHLLKKHHRILFNLKISKITSNILNTIDLEGVKIIHSHFLFSDGAVALKIKKCTNIPYIVVVRNTDVNVFFRFMFHLRRKGVQILLNAEHIIFITPSYVDEVINNYIPYNFREEIKNKISILPNGVNQFWLSNKNTVIKKRTEKLKILYVGDFTPNKNVGSIIEAVKQLKKEGVNINLTLVGGGGSNSNKILRLLNSCDKNVIKFYKRTNSEEELINYYKENNIFVMPSFKETFGVVYLEAMSQGLPIIFTQGQGIDGYFKENSPGYAVNPYNVEDIKNKIILASENIEELSANSLKHIDDFSWDIISKKYAGLYKKILKE